MLEDLIKRLKDFEVRLKDVCVFPALLPDEKYAGIVLNDHGAPSYHLVVIDGECDSLPAAGSLPTWHEVRLASVNTQLKHICYWCMFEGAVRVNIDGRACAGAMTAKFGILKVRRIPV